jgi:hypothetical protein
VGAVFATAAVDSAENAAVPANSANAVNETQIVFFIILSLIN